MTNFLYVVIYKRSDRAALGPFLPTLVFISTIIEIPHAIKRVSHVYAVTEQTSSSLGSQIHERERHTYTTAAPASLVTHSGDMLGL
jgi:hypothetical protein